MQEIARSTSPVLLVALLFCLARCGDDSSGPPDPDAGRDASLEDAGAESDASPGCGDLPTGGEPFAASPEKDEDPSLLRAQDGTIYFAWFSNRTGNEDLYLKSSKDGCTWSEDRVLLADPAADFYPFLFQAADGTFHVVWWRGSLGDAGVGDGGVDIRGTILTMHSSDMQTWSTPQALTDDAGLAWTATMTERVPGELVATWSSNALGDKDVYVRRSLNNGQSWETAIRIVDPMTNDDIPFVAARGGMLTLLYQRYDVALTNLDAPFGHPSNEIAFRSSANGVNWSEPIAMTNDGTPTPDVIGSLVASNDPTGWSAVWTSVRSGSSSDVYLLGLNEVPGTAANMHPLGAGNGGYSARLLPIGDAGNHLMVWVGPGAGGKPDVFRRIVKLP